MTLFYTPDITPGEHYTLPEEESRHGIKVLRLQEGDKVYLADGKGRLYSAEVLEPHPKHCRLRLLDVSEEVGRRPYFLHVAIAPTKNITRFEWFLEKATEIGVDEITPVIARRSERRALRTGRLKKVITSAMKQSLQAYHPVLHEPVGLEDFLAAGNMTAYPGDAGPHDCRLIAHCDEGDKRTIRQVLKPGQSALVLIGPEGDFTPDEVEQALDQGFLPLSLGESRLRTETAGLAVCFETAFLNRD